MRLGGPLFGEYTEPEPWIHALRRLGYSACFCPVYSTQKDSTIQAFVKAARAANIVIAELSAWCNPLSPDDTIRRPAISLCEAQLALADRVGAVCCVGVGGSRAPQWDEPHPDNLTCYTFELVVETVQQIIDAVRPKRTFYTLATMPFAYPDSADSYLRLIKAVDRKCFGVHLDPVNLINSPQRFYDNNLLIRDCFAKLGPYIKSCHAKDVILAPQRLVHLDECRPGQGGLDYRVYLKELNKLDPNTPLMLSGLASEAEYAAAASHVRAIGEEVEGGSSPG